MCSSEHAHASQWSDLASENRMYLLIIEVGQFPVTKECAFDWHHVAWDLYPGHYSIISGSVRTLACIVIYQYDTILISNLANSYCPLLRATGEIPCSPSFCVCTNCSPVPESINAFFFNSWSIISTVKVIHIPSLPYGLMHSIEKICLVGFRKSQTIRAFISKNVWKSRLTYTFWKMYAQWILCNEIVLKQPVDGCVSRKRLVIMLVVVLY